MVGGLGLVALAVTALALGSHGLAAVFLVAGGPLGAFGAMYRHRTKPDEARIPARF